MIEQYPDILEREDGTEIPCRFYPGSRGRGIKNEQDGKQIDVKFTIAFPVDSPKLIQREFIIGRDKSGYEIGRGEVIVFHPGQLHCVAYI